MFARAKSLAVVAVAALLLTGACGSSNESQPKVHIKGDTSASPSQSTPTDKKELQTKFPKAGLEFTKIPDVSGSERQALEAFIDFKLGSEKSGRDLKLSPLVNENASREITSATNRGLKFLRKKGKHFAGTRRVAVTMPKSSDAIVRFDICTDLSDVTMITNGKSGSVDDGDKVAGHATLNLTAKWKVVDYKPSEGTC